jgi:hypothetical protein
MESRKITSNKRMESDSLRQRFAPPSLAAHARRWGRCVYEGSQTGLPEW